MISYQIEYFTDIMEEMVEIVGGHAAETELYQDKVKFNPDYEHYLALDKAGAMFFVTARDEGELVGYTSWAVGPHPHHADHFMGSNNLIYVKKSHRGGGDVATKMFEMAEEELKSHGASVMIFLAKAARPLEGFAERLGYDKVEVAYSKYIGSEE